MPIKKMLKRFGLFAPFLENIILAISIFILFGGFFAGYVYLQKRIDAYYLSRDRLMSLAIELRRSSSDLTKMARAYTTTLDPLYKRHFEEGLSIFDGKSPRPLDYHNIYWELVRQDDVRPRPYSDESISLLELFRREGVKGAQFQKLEEAKINSDVLAMIEMKAMNMALLHPGEAIAMLYSAEYDKAKFEIIKKISEFIASIDIQTKHNVQQAEKMAFWARIAFVFLGLLSFLLLSIRFYKSLYRLFGGSLPMLQETIERIGKGDFKTPIALEEGMQGSILSHLSLMQTKLHESDVLNNRLTRIYAALSQCNQAIVHSTNETELFAQICKDAVIFGGMRMALIGMHDAKERCIKPVAWSGEGIAYAQNLHISTDVDDPTSRGPIGRAFCENKPYWVQDFLSDPLMSLWKEKTKSFGWRGIAVLPLCHDKIPVGVFALYTDEVNAFDALTCNLLEEMAMDIGFAIANFAKEKLQEETHKRSHMLAQVVEQSPNTILITDLDANIEYVNTAFTKFTGYEPFEVLGKNPRILHSNKTPHEKYDDMWSTLLQGKSWIGEFINKRKNGDDYLEEIYISPIFNPDGKIVRYFAIKEDVTEKRAAQKQIYALANFDMLTKLPNRARFLKHLERKIISSKQNNTGFAIMFLDLDHFKDVNDSLGHSVGDLLLIKAAGRIQSSLREEDTVARLGGDEFIILLQNADANGAQMVAGKLLEVITAPFHIESYTLNLSVSIGIAMYPADGEDTQTLVKNADSAMYHAKEEGRNTYRFFTESMQVASLRHLRISNALREALTREELSVHYQPQFCAITGHIVGAEALLRWTHPELGSISPAEFIPVAEENGMILPIGEWVLKTAVQQSKKWIDEGYEPIITAVNLSAIQFRQFGLPDLVAGILSDVGLPSEYLELELTEGVAMHDPKAAIGMMDALHAKGVRMSIDDFGTGYSSLNYLKKFKIYKLKIDQSFVRDISVDVEDKAIISAIINMSYSLGLKTIAEGVETPEQLAYLKEQGCDEIQGYYYSKPLAPKEFEAFRKTTDIKLA